MFHISCSDVQKTPADISCSLIGRRWKFTLWVFVNLKNTICSEAYYMNFTTLFWECCITNLSTRTPTDIFLIQV